MANKAAAGVVLLVLLAIAIFVGIGAVDQATQDQSEIQSVDGEAVERSEDWTNLEVRGNWTEVDQVTFNSQELNRTEDWELDQAAGAIRFAESGGTATVDYRVATMDEQTAANVSVVAPMLNIAGWLVLFVGGGAVLWGIQSLRKSGRGGGGAY